MVQKCPDGTKKVPNCQKHLGLPFRTLLDPFGPLWNVDKPAMFGRFCLFYWFVLGTSCTKPSDMNNGTNMPTALHSSTFENRVNVSLKIIGLPNYTTWPFQDLIVWLHSLAGWSSSAVVDHCCHCCHCCLLVLNCPVVGTRAETGGTVSSWFSYRCLHWFCLKKSLFGWTLIEHCLGWFY